LKKKKNERLTAWGDNLRKKKKTFNHKKKGENGAQRPRGARSLGKKKKIGHYLLKGEEKRDLQKRKERRAPTGFQGKKKLGKALGH